MECTVRACVYICRNGLWFDYCVFYVNKCGGVGIMLLTFALKVAYVNTDIALLFSLVNCFRHGQS